MTEQASDGRTERKASLIGLIPRVAKFFYHLLRDRRVPWTVKAALGGLAVYLATPVDIIPDWIPGAGYLDDVLVVGMAISYIFARLPEGVILEHWGEDVETLKSLRPQRKRG